MKVVMPIRTVNSLNRRGHWAAKAHTAKKQRHAAYWMLYTSPKPSPPCAITLTRIAPRKLDSDGLAASFKHVQDGIADWLGIDDGSDLLTWAYQQRSGKPKEYAVEVEIT